MRDQPVWRFAMSVALGFQVMLPTLACSSADAGSGGLPISPTPQPPAAVAGWQSHSSTAFNYAVQYPPHFVLLPEPSATGDDWVHRARFLDRQLADSPTAHLQPPNFAIEVYVRPAGLSLRQWLDQTSRVPPSAVVGPFSVPGASEAVSVLDRRQIGPNEFYYAANERYFYRLTAFGEGAPNLLASFQLKTAP